MTKDEAQSKQTLIHDMKQPYGDIDDRVRSIAKALGFIRKCI